MDILTFVVELTRALAWPIAVLTLVLILRKPIRELIPLLRRMKYKEIELEFAKEIAELKAETVAPQPALIPPPDENSVVALPQAERATGRRNELLRMVTFSTRVAIMEAWLDLEAAAIDVASSFWTSTSGNVFKDYSRLGEYLLQSKVIDHKQLDVFKRLQRLRNNAAHTQELELDESDARSYIELATALAEHIRAH